MDDSSNCRGSIVRAGNALKIDNALVEEVCANGGGRAEGHLIISHAARKSDNTNKVELLRLNVNRGTIIKNQSGKPACLCSITEGMWVSAVFSRAMTKSIPPQATAFNITVRQRRETPRPPAEITTRGRICRVDAANNFLITGSPRNVNQQMRFNITDETVILNKNGRRVGVSSLMPGQTVEIKHAGFQTASIPPQTTAFSIRIL